MFLNLGTRIRASAVGLDTTLDKFSNEVFAENTASAVAGTKEQAFEWSMDSHSAWVAMSRRDRRAGGILTQAENRDSLRISRKRMRSFLNVGSNLAHSTSALRFSSPAA